MPIQNTEVAGVFTQVADLLEIRGSNPFRVRAYREAARTARSLPEALHEKVRAGDDLSELSGIGDDLASKIEELVETGSLALLEELERETPASVTELLEVDGVGPERARALFEELGVSSLEELGRAAREGRVRELDGFGEQLESSILEALEEHDERSDRTLWSDARPAARELVAHLEGLDGVLTVEVAGSYRRRRETVGDLDVLVTCRRGTEVTAHFVDHEDVDEVLASGETRARVRLRQGLQVDLRVVPQVARGAALFYFTGSKAHNVAVRRRARERGEKLNEYGAFEGDERVAGRTERELYEHLGLAFIPPALREDRGELEAAADDELPDLIETDDLRGDLHCHTDATDGRDGLRAMAATARELGHEYLAITDHTRAARVAGGLDPDDHRRHLDAIAELDAELDGLRLLKGAEVDILEDGTLDLPDDVLESLDVVVASIHSAFDLSREAQTERVLRAFDHPCFQVLAHPTGRLIGGRAGVELDLERVIEGAAERGRLLELNAQPRRMDLPDVWCRHAAEAGVKLVISSDAHTADQLHHLPLGAAYGRRGWLTADHVANTRSWDQLARLLAGG